MEAKQVIVAREDLRMSAGKLASQVSHASLGAFLKAGKKYSDSIGYKKFELIYQVDSDMDNWLDKIFTKIILGCSSEEELISIYDKAKNAGLNVVLITDSGKTEFNNKPTNTCIGIGPHFNDEINKITGHLKTYKQININN